MIRVVLRDGAVYCPTFVCDLCDGDIDEARLAGYWYRVLEDGQPARGPIAVLHKRDCAAAWERANGGRGGWHWDELALLPVFVAANSGLSVTDLDEARRQRAGMDA